MRRYLLVPCLASLLSLTLGLLTFGSWAVGLEKTVNAQGHHTYAIVNIQIAGDAEPALRSQVEAAILRGLKDAGMGRVSLTAVEDAARSTPELAGCLTTTCLDKLGRLVGANRFLLARIVTSGAAYNVELEIVSARLERSGKQVASCTACTMSELGSLISARTRDLVTAKAPAQVELSILSRPAGAQITLRRQGDRNAKPDRAGPAPLKISLAPGVYVVEARLPDHLPVQQVVELEDAGATKSIELTLVRSGTREPISRPFRWAKWGVAGAGIIALGLGTAFLVVDGDPTAPGADCKPRDGTYEQCPFFYDTTAYGVGFLVGGAIAGGAAGWMFWRDFGDARNTADTAQRGRERSGLRLMPTRNGAAISIDF